MLPVTGGALQKIGDYAWGAVLSPDASQIAFRRASGTEIWIMNSSGEKARRLFAAPPGYGILDDHDWSPDGRSIIFGQRNRAATEARIYRLDLATGRTVEIFSDALMRTFTLTRGGQLIYSRLESGNNDWDSNLWEFRLDERSTRAARKPRRLTNWTGFNVGHLSVSANGKLLSFVRERSQTNVYMATLSAGGDRVTERRRLTFDQWIDWPTGWTRDSRTVLFHSNRNGFPTIFRQQADMADGEAIVSSKEEAKDARVSSDGRSILYLAWPNRPNSAPPTQGSLMRIPVSGGAPEIVFSVSGHPGPAGDEHARYRPVPYGAEGSPRFRCPSTPQRPCVLSEANQNEIVFTAFDPLGGRKRELTRITVIPSQPYSWDLSSDGRRIAFVNCEEAAGRIQIIPVSGEAPREVSAEGWTHLTSVAWAPDGNSLFAAAWASKDSPLLHIALDGKTRVLDRANYYIENPVPSPDGRQIAFGEISLDGNVWLIEGTH